jgi:DNA-binding protein Fis
MKNIQHEELCKQFVLKVLIERLAIQKNVKKSINNLLSIHKNFRNLHYVIIHTIEPILIECALSHTKKNVSKASAILGLSRKLLIKKMDKYFGKKYFEKNKNIN